MKNKFPKVLNLLFIAIFTICCGNNNKYLEKESETLTVNDSNLSSFVTENKPKTKAKYVGCWIGLKQGNIVFTESYLYDYLKDKTTAKKFSFVETTLTDEDAKNETYLLEMKDLPDFGHLQKFNLVKFKNDEEIIIYGYKSYENYVAKDFESYFSFVKTRTKCN